MKSKPYIRKKGKWADGETKYIIEQRIEGKSKNLGTLPKTIGLLELLRPGNRPEIPSESTNDPKVNILKKYAQPKLSELQNSKKTKTATEEEIKELWETTK